jgi:SOS response associated peptidase (SRAP)
MCGRVIQSSGPLRYAIVDGMNVRDSRVRNYPPRWNAAPSQELLGYPPQSQDRRSLNRPAALGAHSLLVQGPRGRAQADQRQVRDGSDIADVPRRLPPAPLHRARGGLLRVEGDQGAEGKAALRHRHERWRTIQHRWHLGELERAASGEWIRTFAVITTDANEMVAAIHNRMPAILAPGDYVRWLSDEPDPRDLMRPFPADLMRMWPISTRVNSENDDPSIVEPVELATDAA